jgi:hypothetical protein
LRMSATAAPLNAACAVARHQASKMSAPGHQSIRQTCGAPRQEPIARKRSQRAPQVEHLNTSTIPCGCIFTSLPINTLCGGTITGFPSNPLHSLQISTHASAGNLLSGDQASKRRLDRSRHTDRKTYMPTHCYEVLTEDQNGCGRASGRLRRGE